MTTETQPVPTDSAAAAASPADLLSQLSGLDYASLRQLQKALNKRVEAARPARELPAVNSDFYGALSDLKPELQALRVRVRHFMESEVAPLVADYWERGEFPRQLIERVKRAGFAHDLWGEDGQRHDEGGLTGFLIGMEMARVDPSFGTFFGVHTGLAMLSVSFCGSETQKAEWLPQMRDLTKIGAFGLTEPLVGSGAAGGLTTTARRQGDSWVLSGQKKWIGNATFADMVVIWARDLADNQVKGFIVRTENPGYSVEKIGGKIALRMVENGLITLTDCVVPESDRLQRANSFRDTANVLRATRAGVAWSTLGCATGAYELALNYTRTREQFGKKLGEFQLIQKHLVTMLGNVTAMQTMVLRLAELQSRGQMQDEQASLAKQFMAARCREVVAHAREVLGGNGILLEFGVAKLFADAEALYSYEGTDEVNSLIVGRAVTGFSAFV